MSQTILLACETGGRRKEREKKKKLLVAYIHTRYIQSPSPQEIYWCFNYVCLCNETATTTRYTHTYLYIHTSCVNMPSRYVCMYIHTYIHYKYRLKLVMDYESKPAGSSCSGAHTWLLLFVCIRKLYYYSTCTIQHTHIRFQPAGWCYREEGTSRSWAGLGPVPAFRDLQPKLIFFGTDKVHVCGSRTEEQATAFRMKLVVLMGNNNAERVHT